METSRVWPVVVVGAGPTGVTAATLLALHGVECLVLERFGEAYPQPRAVHVDDEVFRILARIGVGEEFAAISRPMLGLRLLDQDHRVLAEFQRGEPVSANGFPQANLFDQPELERVLRGNLKRQPLATLRGNCEVLGVAPGEPVRLRVRDRAAGAEETIRARYVLGCDGANSLVRRALGIDMRDLGFRQRWLVVDVRTAADLRQWDGVHQVCDPRRAATYMRIGADRYRWEFQLRNGESAADFPDVGTLRPLIAPWIGGLDDGALELIRSAEYTFRAQVAQRWRAGPVFLLGDAAHLTPPFIGQGLGAGLRDAYNLAWKLAGVLAGRFAEPVLDTYQAEREPHVRGLIRLAVAMGWAMTAGGSVGSLARRLIVPRLRLVPGLQSKAVDSATPPLRRGPLVRAARWRRGLAGRLVPNPMIGAGRLDDVAGGRFVVITGHPDAAAVTELAHHLDAVTLDVEDHAVGGSGLRRWLGRALAAVVRPDGAVLAAGSRRDLARAAVTIENGSART